MKGKKIIMIAAIIAAVLVALCAVYFISLTPVSKKSEEVTFKVKAGDSKTKIITNLKSAKLIRSKASAYIYIVTNQKMNIQAGTYHFNRNMSLGEIIDSLNAGKTNEVAKTVSVTFVEGRTVLEYADVITENFGYKPDEIKAVLKDEKFTKQLIKDYWFLEEKVLDKDIYYALEGYLFPDTYQFYDNASIENIITKMLDNTAEKLEPFKEDIAASGYSVHEVLSMAAIIEKEAVTKEDRAAVSQVIHKRLSLGMALGMDVTTYYAVGKSLKEDLTSIDLNSNSPYNTRNINLVGLPIGPICNPGEESINAALHPSATNYLYFYADLATGKVYFAETQEEFLKFKREIGG